MDADSRDPVTGSTLTEDELALLLMQVSEDPPDNPAPEAEEFWIPGLTEGPQIEVFYDETDNTLVPGQRYTGKGWACGYNLVKHAYDYYDALVLVVVKTKRQGSTGGFFSKLGGDILPDFARNLQGFVYKGPYLTIEKDVVYSVVNRYGGKSVIQMISIQHDADLFRKIKGIEASKVYVDEVTLFETEEVVVQLRGTLKRRRHVPAEAQTLLASCNPDDPEHWVATRWGLEFAADGTLLVEKTNAKNPAYRVIEVPKECNPSPHVVAYYENLSDALKNRPTQYARDVEGKWVAAPEGDAIFRDSFVRSIHVRGDLVKNEVLYPIEGLPCTLGWDPGDVNHGVVFLQEISTSSKIIWLAFDEVVYVKKQISLELLTREVMDRMQFWAEELGQDIRWQHVSDKSAFDRFRATAGTYDVREIEKHFRDNMAKYSRLNTTMRMTECPKPAGSVEARTRLIVDMLHAEELYVSARCKNLIDTLEKIAHKKDAPFTPDTRSRYKHAFDALTYPLYYSRLMGTRPSVTAALKPQLIRIGS